MSSTKSRHRQPKFKVQRRLGQEIPGLGKPGALAKRNYPPGIHGLRKRRFSEYGVRLTEKQKVIAHYNMKEKQMRRFVSLAKRGSGRNWTETLFGLLESRLDNLVFRLGFAASIPAARQMVVHKKVLVDGKCVWTPSVIVKVGSEVSLVDKCYEAESYQILKKTPRLEVPAYLDKQEVKKKDIGKLVEMPTTEAIPFELEKRFISEFYAHVK